MLPYLVSTVLYLTFKSVIILGWFLYDVWGSAFHPFAYEYPEIPTLSVWRDYSFLVEFSWHPCQDQFRRDVRVYSWMPSSVALIYTSIFMPFYTGLDYCGFAASLKFISMWPSGLLCFFETILLFIPHMNFKINLPTSFLKDSDKNFSLFFFLAKSQ